MFQNPNVGGSITPDALNPAILNLLRLGCQGINGLGGNSNANLTGNSSGSAEDIANRVSNSLAPRLDMLTQLNTKLDTISQKIDQLQKSMTTPAPAKTNQNPGINPTIGTRHQAPTTRYATLDRHLNDTDALQKQLTAPRLTPVAVTRTSGRSTVAASQR